jgi:hypothetical protein
MQELIDHLKEKAGLTAEQATNTIVAVKDYVKQKFPMLEGAVENMLGSQTSQDGASAEGGASDFLNNAGSKAEEAFDSIKGKLSGLFSDNK